MKIQGYKHLGCSKSELEYSAHLSLGWKMLLLFQTQGLKDNRSISDPGGCRDVFGWLAGFLGFGWVFLDVIFNYSKVIFWSLV